MKITPPPCKMNSEDGSEFHEEFLRRPWTRSMAPVGRRGTGMGLGGTVEGLHTQTMAQHSILKRVNTAAIETKNVGVRFGVLYVLEGLSRSFGKVFGPYDVKQRFSCCRPSLTTRRWSRSFGAGCGGDDEPACRASRAAGAEAAL